MKLTRTKTGYTLDMTRKEANEIATEVALKVAMGLVGEALHEKMGILVATDILEREQKPRPKKRKTRKS